MVKPVSVPSLLFSFISPFFRPKATMDPVASSLKAQDFQVSLDSKPLTDQMHQFVE